MTTEKNRIVLKNPVTQKRRAEYHLEVTGPWAAYFQASDFYAEYSHSVEFAAYAILMVPVLSIVLPFAWICGAEVSVEFADKDFVQDMEELKKALAARYPGVIRESSLVCSHEVRKRQKDGEGNLVFGEGDALFESMLRHEAGEKAVSVLILGDSISTEDKTAVKEAKAKAQIMADKAGAELCICSTDLGSMLRLEQAPEFCDFPEPEVFAEMCRTLSCAGRILPTAWNKKVQRILIPPAESEAAASLLAGIRLSGKELTFCGSLPALKPEETGQTDEKTGADFRLLRCYLIGTPEDDSLAGQIQTEGIRAFIEKSAPGIQITEMTRTAFFEREAAGTLQVLPSDILAIQGEDFLPDRFDSSRKIVFNTGRTPAPGMIEAFLKREGKAEWYSLPDPMLLFETEPYPQREKTGLLVLTENEESGKSAELDKIALRSSLAVMKENMSHGRRLSKEERRMYILRKLDMIASREAVLTDSPYGMMASMLAETPCVWLRDDAEEKSAGILNQEGVFTAAGIRDAVEALSRLRLYGASVSQKRETGSRYEAFGKAVHDMFDEALEEWKMRTQDTPLVSVVIPVYNEERYVKECLDSLLSQTYQNYEAICVDDGSTDLSPDILEDYAKRDPRFHVIHQENQGLSATRNHGIAEACGKYIFFLDSDDWIKADHIEKLVQHMEADNLDICLGNAEPFVSAAAMSDSFQAVMDRYREFYKRCYDYPDVCTGLEMIRLMRGRKEYLMPVWSYMSRTEYLKNSDNPFVEGILHEDNIFTFRHLCGAKRVGFCKDVFYQRRLADESIMTSPVSFRNVEGYFRCFLEACRYLEAHEMSEEDQNAVLDITQSLLGNARHRYEDLCDAGSPERDDYKKLPAYEQMLFRALILEYRAYRVVRLEKEKKELANQLRAEENRSNAIDSEKKELEKKKDALESENSELKGTLKEIRSSIAYRGLHKFKVM